MFSISRLFAATALAGSVAVLTACSGAAPSDSAPPPPPPSAGYYAPAPNDLAGAPPPPPSDGLLGGPSAAPAPVYGGMAPIPNPLDLPLEERHRIYGTKYDRGHAAPARTGTSGRTAAATTPAPKAAATAPASKAAPAAKAAAPADPQAARLQAAIGSTIASASTLKVAESIKAGQAGEVVLSLPQNVLDVIREQAAKLGLGRAARTTDVTATLSGEGYTITPNGPQTATLKSGEAPSFKWQVTPLPGINTSDLRARFDAILRGERNARTVPLGELQQPGAPPPAPPEKQGFKFPGLPNLGGLKLPDYGTVNLPGFGETPSRVVIGIGLVLAALILLIAAARRAAEAKAAAARRRKFRTMSDYAATEPEPVYEQPATVYAEPEPEPATTYPQPVETTTVYAQPEPEPVQQVSDQTPAEAELTEEERKANWPWRKDDAVEKEPEKV
jgi:hypothetical protein